MQDHIKRQKFIENYQAVDIRSWKRHVDTGLMVGHMRLQMKVELLLHKEEQMPSPVLSQRQLESPQ